MRQLLLILSGELLKFTPQLFGLRLRLRQFHHFTVIAQHLLHDGSRAFGVVYGSIRIDPIDAILTLSIFVYANSFLQHQTFGKDYTAAVSVNPYRISSRQTRRTGGVGKFSGIIGHGQRDGCSR